MRRLAGCTIYMYLIAAANNELVLICILYYYYYSSSSTGRSRRPRWPHSLFFYAVTVLVKVS
jgi:hypothetical protein